MKPTKEQWKKALLLLEDSRAFIDGGPAQGLADDIQTFLNEILIQYAQGEKE